MTVQQLIPAQEFCKHYGIEISFLQSLQEFELIILREQNGEQFIQTEELLLAEKLVRLHIDLQVNLEALDIIQRLLKLQQALNDENRNLRNKLAFYENGMEV